MAVLLGCAVGAVLPPQVLPPQAAASGLGSVTLRFDGSLRGRSGGAGAVLLHEGTVVWQAARYLERPATSAHAEYEGLLLGLRGARALRVRQVTAEGDCRLVLRQMEGKAAWSKCSLGTAPARPLRLLGARLVALGGVHGLGCSS